MNLLLFTHYNENNITFTASYNDVINSALNV